MTTTVLAPYLTSQFFASNGAFLAGGQMFTYQAGTVTPIATYIDNTGTTTNTNPIVLNARGECSIWLLPNTSYKFVLQDGAGNTIWTRDQIIEAQLLTLFGGVDTGSANTYLLNFAWPYTSYANGEVIYFIPGNSNSGPSTLNVNGLGVIPITNIDGSPLGANQIQAGQTTQVMYYNGAFQLLAVGSFSGVTVGTFGREVPIASAATTDLGLAPAHVVLVTGTATITSFGASANVAAPIYMGRFSSTLTLTYSGVSLILPGNASIVTTPGDSFIAQYLGSGNWKVVNYQTITGSSSASGNNKIKPADTAITSDATVNPDPDLQSNTLTVGRYAWQVFLIFDSVAGGAGFKWTNTGTAVDSRAAAPALASGFVNAAAYGPKAESPYGATISYATVGTAANSNIVIYTGSLLVVTPGTFGLSWSQVASTASATTLRAGSYMTLTLLNTGSSANIIQHTYTTPGAFVETIPVGYTTLTLEVWGAGGGGGGGTNTAPNGVGGGGAGAGGYSRSSISVVGLGGDTLNFTVGAAGIPAGVGGTSAASSGTLAITTMTCLGGQPGVNAPPAGNGGIGGTAVGGTVVNTTGGTGNAGQSNPAGGGGGVGAFGTPGVNGGGNPGGGGGFLGHLSGFAGGVGVVVFTYSP